jgi:hypothetical protein
MQLVDGRPCPNCLGTGEVLKRRELSPYSSAYMRCPLCINGYESEYHVFQWLALAKKDKIKPVVKHSSPEVLPQCGQCSYKPKDTSDFYRHLQSEHSAKSTPFLTDEERTSLAQLFEDFVKPEPRPEAVKPAVTVPHHFIPSNKNGRLCNVCLGLIRDRVHITEKPPEAPIIDNTPINPPHREWSSSHHLQGMSAREMDYERRRILKKPGNFNRLALFNAIYAFCQIILGLLSLIPQANHDLAVRFYSFFYSRDPFTAATFYEWWQEWSTLIGVGFTVLGGVILFFSVRKFIMRGKYGS